jgi:hypothetical protein
MPPETTNVPDLPDLPDVDACTLPTAARPLRLAEFDALFAGTLLRQERLDPRRLRLTLAGQQGLELTVQDLTRRETECCSFFGFTVTPTHVPAGAAEAVVLDVTVPAAQVAVLDGLVARARLVAPRAGG